MKLTAVSFGILLAALRLSATSITVTGSANLGGNDLVTDLLGENTAIHLALDSGLGYRSCIIDLPCTLSKTGAGGNPSDTTSVYGTYAGQPVSFLNPAAAVLDFVGSWTFGPDTGTFEVPADVLGDILIGPPASPLHLRLSAHGSEAVMVLGFSEKNAQIYLRDVTFSGTLNEIPEPSSTRLLGAGILALGLARRFARAHRA